ARRDEDPWPQERPGCTPRRPPASPGCRREKPLWGRLAAGRESTYPAIIIADGRIAGMSHLDRALGLARSLAIYHAIPRRQRRMRHLYADFVTRDDLVFDVGAHVGNRTRAFRALGCRVVAIE